MIDIRHFSKTVCVSVSLTRRQALGLFSAALLGFLALKIGSESLSLTTYYPSSTGSFVKLSANKLIVKAEASFAGAVDLNGTQLTNVPDPSNPQDIATKKYVDDEFSTLTVQKNCVGKPKVSQAGVATDYCSDPKYPYVGEVNICTPQPTPPNDGVCGKVASGGFGVQACSNFMCKKWKVGPGEKTVKWGYNAYQCGYYVDAGDCWVANTCAGQGASCPGFTQTAEVQISCCDKP